jgi:hypothetical protein
MQNALEAAISHYQLLAKFPGLESQNHGMPVQERRSFCCLFLRLLRTKFANTWTSRTHILRGEKYSLWSACVSYIYLHLFLHPHKIFISIVLGNGETE